MVFYMHKNYTPEHHYFPSHGRERKKWQRGDTKGWNGKIWEDKFRVLQPMKGLQKKGSAKTYGNGCTLGIKPYGNLATKTYGNGSGLQRR